MHPIFSSRARLGTYLLGWVPIGAVLAFMGYSQGWTALQSIAFALPCCLLAAFLFLSSWYLCRALPLEGRTLGSLWPAWLLASLLMAHVWFGLSLLVALALSRLPHLQELFLRARKATPVLIAAGMLLYLAVLALHYLLEAVARGKEAEDREKAMRLLAQDAELRALRAQLNPHFLFNSLNSISALTTLDPARARRMCILLSDFLRGSLKLGERKLVALSEEVDLLKAYLAIEQIRFGERLQVAWAIEPEAAAEQVPALLLQPLVENAIKHGIAGLPEGGRVHIGARLADGNLLLSVENPVDPDTPVVSGLGLGLRQVQSRLQLRWGGRMRLEAGVRDGVHRVHIIVPALGGALPEKADGPPAPGPSIESHEVQP